MVKMPSEDATSPLPTRLSRRVHVIPWLLAQTSRDHSLELGFHFAGGGHIAARRGVLTGHRHAGRWLRRLRGQLKIDIGKQRLRFVRRLAREVRHWASESHDNA